MWPAVACPFSFPESSFLMASIASSNRQIARAAGMVMMALIAGQIAGLARSILVAHLFGASAELSAFYYGNRVSETLFLLVAGGALGSAFLPTFTGLLAKGEQAAAWRLAVSLARLVTLILGLLAGLAAWFAPWIVRHVLAPGFSADPDLFALTVALLRIQLLSAILFGLGGLVVGVLNAHQVFLVPALTPAMYQIGIIFGALVLSSRWGVYGLAWGVVIGAALYLALQIPTLWRLKPDLHGPTPWRSMFDVHVRHVLALMGPRVIGVAVVQINFWVNGYLASFMGQASMAGLSYGFSLMLMAQAAIAQSVAIAAMPTFSAQHALGQREALRTSLAASLRGVILLAVPASLGLIVLRQPLVAMLFQRGAFDASSTDLVAWALLWYAAGLVGHSILEVLTRAFYAQHDTRTPVLIGGAAMLLNIGLSIGFSQLFARLGWMPHGGLALANSLATALEATGLFVALSRRLNGLEETWIARGAAQAIVAALGMSLALGVWRHAAGGLNRWLIGLGGVALGGMVYGAILFLWRVPEVWGLWAWVLRRIRRLANRPAGG